MQCIVGLLFMFVMLFLVVASCALITGLSVSLGLTGIITAILGWLNLKGKKRQLEEERKRLVEQAAVLLPPANNHQAEPFVGMVRRQTLVSEEDEEAEVSYTPIIRRYADTSPKELEHEVTYKWME